MRPMNNTICGREPYFGSSFSLITGYKWICHQTKWRLYARLTIEASNINWQVCIQASEFKVTETSKTDYEISTYNEF